MIREYFLQQNGFDPVDAYSGVEQQYAMAKAILTFQNEAKGDGCRCPPSGRC